MSCSTLAAKGRLRAPGVLDQQVRRMLADATVAGARRQLRRAVALPAQPARADSELERVPRLRRQPPSGIPARIGALLRQHRPRGPERRRSADGELHVRERAPGASTTASRTCTAASSAASRWPIRNRMGLLGQGSGADDDIARGPDVSGSSRQVDSGEHPRHAAAAAARQRAAAQGQEHAGEAADDAGADGRAPGERRHAPAATS